MLTECEGYAVWLVDAFRGCRIWQPRWTSPRLSCALHSSFSSLKGGPLPHLVVYHDMTSTSLSDLCLLF